MALLLKSLSKKAADKAAEALAKKSARAAELETKAAEAYAKMPEYLQDPYLGLSTSNIGKVSKAVLDKTPRMSKAESEALGLYHPIGNKIKLKKPISEMTETTIPNPEVQMTTPRILTPEDLYGKAGIPLIGDRAATGKILTHIDERALNRPVTLEGGPEFMLAHHYPDDPMASSVWASGRGKVTALNNRIREAAESGDDVLGIYSAGSPVQVDYNAMLSHTLANQIDLGALKKKDINSFNKSIREKFPDFVGIEHPDLDVQLGLKSSGPLRSHFVDRMKLKDFQDAGFPNIAQARKAITEPSLLDVPLGSTGFTIGKMNPEGAIVEAPRMPHGTYAIHMQGIPEGRLETQLPYDVMFKTHTDARKMMPGSQPKTVYRSYELTQPIQYFDQEWLDNAMKYLDDLEKKKGYADGGEVLKEEPRGKVTGAIADILKPASDFLSQYEVKDYVPLIGGTDLAELTGIKGTQSLADEMSRGYSPIHGGSLQTSKFDPRLIDAASLLPSVGPMVKGAKAIGRTAFEQGAKNIAEGRLIPGLIVNPRQNILPESGVNLGVDFFRPSEDTIRGHKMDVMPGNQWYAWLQSNAPKSSKKELETSGTMNWLKDSQDKISKKDIINHLRENEPNLRSRTYSEYSDSPYEVYGGGDDGYHVVNTSMSDKPISSHETQGEAYWALNELESELYPKPAYSKWTLPGGDDYREIVIQDKSNQAMLDKNSPKVIEEAIRSYGEDALPKLSQSQWDIVTKRINQKFESSHYPEATNPIAHLRINHRDDVNGNPTLFIEELQSDWGQKGKKEGFGKKTLPTDMSAEDLLNKYRDNLSYSQKAWLNNFIGQWEAVDAYNNVPNQAQKLDSLTDLYQNWVRSQDFGVSRGPYVEDTKDWTALALKQAIKEAVDNGKKQIAWTSGAQQAERYDLSKHLSSVSLRPSEYSKDKVHLMAIDHSGNPVIEKTVKENELDEYIGKDLANKLINTAPGGDSNIRRLEGLDIKVGGEGMHGYYDQILPQVANDVIKQLGGKNKVKPIAIDLDGETSEQLGFEITPDMIRFIKEEAGIPKFKSGGAIQLKIPSLRRKHG